MTNESKDEMNTYGTPQAEEERKDYSIQDEALLRKTQAYPMKDIMICPVHTEMQPDLMNPGNNRRRKHAIVLSMAGIPNFDQMPEPVAVGGGLPYMLIDGDDMDDLEKRAIEEMKQMFQLYRDTCDGSFRPDQVPPGFDLGED